MALCDCSLKMQAYEVVAVLEELCKCNDLCSLVSVDFKYDADL